MPSVHPSNPVKFTSLRLFRCRAHANPMICRPAAVAQEANSGRGWIGMRTFENYSLDVALVFVRLLR